jgi:hypothetical protein
MPDDDGQTHRITDLRRIVRTIVNDAAPSALLEIIGELEAAKIAAQHRLFADTAGSIASAVLVAATPSTPAPAPVETPQWITAPQAAELAKVSERQIYRWARGQRWASRPSPNVLRIEAHSFSRWLSRQQ